MRVAVTGATGFVGRNLVRQLVDEGHTVVAVARSRERHPELLNLPGVEFAASDLSDAAVLSEAFVGCDAVAHLAGINREIGAQTFERVHVQGTRNVVDAACRSGVPRIALLSFLRARPNCGSAYHESKWAAEEIVRGSELDYTVLKAGVIYGRGDHMLDHLSHAFYTFPVFGLVGFERKPIAPTAVADVAAVLRAALTEGRLTRATVRVIGPDVMTLEEAVRRVANAVDRQPIFFRLPVAAHYGIAWLTERLMKVPLVAMAQVRILSEGLVEPAPFADDLPEDLRPGTPFSRAAIVEGLPEAGPFTRADLTCTAPPRLTRAARAAKRPCAAGAAPET